MHVATPLFLTTTARIQRNALDPGCVVVLRLNFDFGANLAKQPHFSGTSASIMLAKETMASGRKMRTLNAWWHRRSSGPLNPGLECHGMPPSPRRQHRVAPLFCPWQASTDQFTMLRSQATAKPVKRRRHAVILATRSFDICTFC